METAVTCVFLNLIEGSAVVRSQGLIWTAVVNVSIIDREMLTRTIRDCFKACGTLNDIQWRNFRIGKFMRVLTVNGFSPTAEIDY